MNTLDFSQVYVQNIDTHKKRYAELTAAHKSRFGNGGVMRYFSSPGRTEICGNHTDHNMGKVIAASIHLDCIAAVTAADNIHIVDTTYNEEFTVVPHVPGGPKSAGGGGEALVCGIAAYFNWAGWRCGGFNAVISSDILPAAGVSSSAAFEMLVCQILNNLYNDGRLPVEKLAQAGRYAENVYWNKASGLLDQMGCAAGGLIAIDFANPAAPCVEKISFDFAAQKTRIILVNTGGNHANLSGEYSAIPREMMAAAAVFGKETLCGLTSCDIAEKAAAIRAAAGDRALLRALHFTGENLRVDAQKAALHAGDFSTFLNLVAASGNSSWKYLQNVYIASEKAVKSQNISVCLALTEVFIREHTLEGRAACRIHGGGFAGVMQFFVPESFAKKYADWMSPALNKKENCLFDTTIRQYGVVEILRA
ncbi:MAG: galactokinase [Spirochaetaceae bacterium]|jgi:galactokinase|nr:galactokinase [Spirochaetaceae bacterium]